MYSCRAELDEEIKKLEAAIQRAKSEYVDVEVLNAGANAEKLLPILQSLCDEPKFRSVQDLQQEIEKLNATVTNMNEIQDRILIAQRINKLKSLVALNNDKVKNLDASVPPIPATNNTNMDDGVPATNYKNNNGVVLDIRIWTWIRSHFGLALTGIIILVFTVICRVMHLNTCGCIVFATRKKKSFSVKKLLAANHLTVSYGAA